MSDDFQTGWRNGSWVGFPAAPARERTGPMKTIVKPAPIYNPPAPQYEALPPRAAGVGPMKPIQRGEAIYNAPPLDLPDFPASRNVEPAFRPRPATIDDAPKAVSNK